MAYKYDYIPIKKSECPCRKIFSIGSKTYILEFKYNTTGDFFTLGIYDNDTEELLYVTKLVYGASIINAKIKGLDLEYVVIPMNLDDLFSDLTIADQTVNAENLGITVNLYFNEQII
jgi:outer membrane receptor protein involved in Fe transport